MPEHDAFHRIRRKQILREHPEVRKLFTKDPSVMFWAVAVAAFQIVIAMLIPPGAWWISVILAFLVGGFACHASNVLIHEACHDLIFRGAGRNKAAGIIANAAGVFPSAIPFRHFHLLHHRFPGELGRDADMPMEWEIRLFDGSRLGKFIWLLLLPIWYTLLHPLIVRPRLPFDGWLAFNAVVTIGVFAAVTWFGGWAAGLYLILSVIFSVGCHPAGAHILQEHIWFGAPRETSSYYGPLNAISFNFGYHTEHHDFCSIPARNLRKLRNMAADYYIEDPAYRSRIRLMWRFVTDPRISLRRRNHSPETA